MRRTRYHWESLHEDTSIRMRVVMASMESAAVPVCERVTTPLEAMTPMVRTPGALIVRNTAPLAVIEAIAGAPVMVTVRTPAPEHVITAIDGVPVAEKTGPSTPPPAHVMAAVVTAPVTVRVKVRLATVATVNTFNARDDAVVTTLVAAPLHIMALVDEALVLVCVKTQAPEHVMAGVEGVPVTECNVNTATTPEHVIAADATAPVPERPATPTPAHVIAARDRAAEVV